MCGRLVYFTDAESLAALFDVADFGGVPNLPPSYNLPPSREAYTVGLNPLAGRRGLAVMRWGLVPSWWQGTRMDALKPSNACGETVASSPMFRDSFRSRRIIVPADGFYEWRQTDKVPFAFQPAVGRVFALGAIWDAWTDTETGEGRTSFALVTTTPNALMGPIHDRMPVILDPDDWAAWLDPATPTKAARALIRPCPPEAMTAHRVSPAVGSVRNDSPKLLEPFAPPPVPVDLFAQFA